MISAQTLCVCREGKPLRTHRVVARGHAFPDHALARAYSPADLAAPHALAARGILSRRERSRAAPESLARGFVDIDRACGILEAASVTACPNDASESGGRTSPERPILE